MGVKRQVLSSVSLFRDNMARDRCPLLGEDRAGKV